MPWAWLWHSAAIAMPYTRAGFDFKSGQAYTVSMMIDRKTVKSVRIGSTDFILPFRSAGLWVEDARGKNVCECPSQDLAKALAQFMNEKAQ